MKVRNLIVLACCTTLTSAAFGANIIDSLHGTGAGSFEINGFADPRFITLPDGSTLLLGWTVEGSVDWVKSSVWNASSGGYSIDLNGTPALPTGAPVPGALSTIIATTVGSSYRVTFDMAGFLGFGSSTNPKVMSVNAGEVTTNYSLSATNTSETTPLALVWTTATFDFVATTPGPTVLTFTSLTTNNHSAMLLDNVRVESIPEPAAPLLFGAAGILLTFRRRGR